jgi:RHS repeat-associated protein
MRNLTVEQQYSPNLGSTNVMDGFTTDINAPYTFSSSLPTQVFKVYAKNNATTNYSRIIGEKSYELNDHLGNFNDTWVLSSKTLSGINPVRNLSEATGIRVVISDRKYLADRDDNDNISTGDNFVPEVLSANEYGAFGNLLNGRGFSQRDYSRGFNGMLKDDEIKGSGNHYTSEWRQYDPRIGRFMSLDPAMKKYASWNPYSFSFNNPIYYSDPNGDDPITALVEALTSFGIDIGLDFITTWLIEGKSVTKSIESIGWWSASWGAFKTYITSTVSVPGAVRANKLIKLSNTTAGKITISIVEKMALKAMDNYSQGKYDDDGEFDFGKVDLTLLFWESTIETLIEKGFASRASGLLENMKKQNKKLYEKLKKLENKINNGEAQKRVTNYTKVVNKELDKSKEFIKSRVGEVATEKTITKAGGQTTKKAVEGENENKTNEKKTWTSPKASF